MRHFLLVLFSFNNRSLDWEGGRGGKIPIKTMCAWVTTASRTQGGNENVSEEECSGFLQLVRIY